MLDNRINLLLEKSVLKLKLLNQIDLFGLFIDLQIDNSILDNFL